MIRPTLLTSPDDNLLSLAILALEKNDCADKALGGDELIVSQILSKFSTGVKVKKDLKHKSFYEILRSIHNQQPLQDHNKPAFNPRYQGKLALRTFAHEYKLRKACEVFIQKSSSITRRAQKLARKLAEQNKKMNDVIKGLAKAAQSNKKVETK